LQILHNSTQLNKKIILGISIFSLLIICKLSFINIDINNNIFIKKFFK